jgi:hypothetical protein
VKSVRSGIIFQVKVKHFRARLISLQFNKITLHKNRVLLKLHSHS